MRSPLDTPYILQSPKRGQRGRAVLEMKTRPDGSEEAVAILHLPEGTPSETMGDVLEALRRAHQAGREERSAELIPDPGDMLRDAIQSHATAALTEWLPRITEPLGDYRNYRIEQVAADEANRTIDVTMGIDEHDPYEMFRIRVLVEEIPPHE